MVEKHRARGALQLQLLLSQPQTCAMLLLAVDVVEQLIAACCWQLLPWLACLHQRMLQCELIALSLGVGYQHTPPCTRYT
jgi:hypothetical protein